MGGPEEAAGWDYFRDSRKFSVAGASEMMEQQERGHKVGRDQMTPGHCKG